MKNRYFVTRPGAGLTEVQEAPEPGAGGCVWVDAEAFEPSELSAFLKSNGFSRAAIRAAAGSKGRTRVATFDSEVFFELPALATEIGSQRVALAFLCRPDLCVTLHREPVKGLSLTADQLDADTEADMMSLSAVVGALLAGLSRRAVDATDEIRERVLAMQGVLDEDPSEIDTTEMNENSSGIRALDSVISERVVVLDRLRLLESPILSFTDNRDFRVAASDTQYLDRAIDRLEKRVDGLREQYAMHLQDRTSRRLAVLTVLSAVFLPLTLLAGIYGMNFQVMPELTYPWGYPAVLTLMVAIGVGMILFFRSRGWFD
jgi:magnesium transporter